MSEEVFDPNDLPARRKEKVRLSNGKVLWVWDMDAADWLRGTERSIIRTGPLAGHTNITDSLVWKILASCYTSDSEKATRIFNEENMLQIYRLPSRDFQAINDAISRVNGTDAETAEELERFFERGKDGGNGTSSAGVSSSSTAFPPRSEARPAS